MQMIPGNHLQAKYRYIACVRLPMKNKVFEYTVTVFTPLKLKFLQLGSDLIWGKLIFYIVYTDGFHYNCY